MRSEAAALRVPLRAVKLKRLILPTEHGSWGFLLEPLVASLAVAFSIGGIWIALMVVGGFLSRQPLRYLLLGIAGNGFRTQTIAALCLTIVFSAFFALGLAGAVATANPWSLFPFLVVAPLVSYQIFCDLSLKSRNLLPEVTGAVAISSSAAAIAFAGGMPWANAMAVWAIFIGRLIPSVLYVRTRLRLDKGKLARPFNAIFAHFIALSFVFALAWSGLVSYLIVAAFVILFARAAFGLSGFRKRVKAMKIGIAEILYGVLTVAAFIAGHFLWF